MNQLQCIDIGMKRSQRDSTTNSRERSAQVHQGHLNVKLRNAATWGRLDEVLEMLEKYNFDGMELGLTMFHCIRHGNIKLMYSTAIVIDLIEKFIFHGANMYAVDEFGMDLVSVAIRTRDTTIARFIIDSTEYGIAHKDTTRDWHEPRMFEVSTVEMAKLIMEYGADVSETGMENRPLLEKHACEWIRYMSKPGCPDGEKFDVIRFLVETLKCPVNEGSDSGRTALHWVAGGAAGDPAIVQFLIDHGADVHAVDNDGRTPLFYAVENGTLSNVEILCESGADISKRDINMITPLDLAVSEAARPHAIDSDFLILEYLDTELTRREKTAAFVMGYHERLGRKDVGKPSPLLNMSPDLLRCILENGGYVNKV
jgi:hypothetical protein